MNFRTMALGSILSRDDLHGWRTDLIETGLTELADDLFSIMLGIDIGDAKVYRLAFYMLHVESVGNG